MAEWSECTRFIWIGEEWNYWPPEPDLGEDYIGPLNAEMCLDLGIPLAALTDDLFIHEDDIEKYVSIPGLVAQLRVKGQKLR